MCDLDNKIKVIQETRIELDKYHTKMQFELGVIDKEIVDIEHYIEFYNFSASQGYKVYKMLQERFIKRRTLKDEIQKCNIIWGNAIRDFTENDGVIKKINNIDNRKYKARVLKELFDVKDLR